MLLFRAMVARALAACVFLLCAGVVFWYALAHTVHRGILAVPALAGLELAEADRTAHDLGLAIEVEEPGVFSAEVAPGAVAAQRPYAGFHVKVGSTVTVRLSLGGERVSIPALVAESLPSAIRRLEDANLRPGARAEVHGESGADAVLATDPPAGREVPPTTAVGLLVNTAPTQELWVMPSLLLRPLAATRRFCRRHRLRLGQVHEVAYAGVPSGLVLRQYPPAGSPLSRSDIMTIWASR